LGSEQRASSLGSPLPRGQSRMGGLEAFRCLPRGVVAKASLVALPPATISGALTYLEYFKEGMLDDFAEHWSVNGSAFTSFTGLLGILIVFRTSQAYSRYWDGTGLLHTITGNFFDAAARVVAFTVTSTADQGRVDEFRQTVASLTSLISAACLAELAGDEHNGEAAANIIPLLDIIGWASLSEGMQRAVQEEKQKVHLAILWWQSYVIRATAEKVIDIPGPCLSSAIGEMCAGLGNFESCLKLSRVSFPRSYTQIAIWLLKIHWVLTPLVVMGWSQRPSLAFTFTFVLVFVFWGLFFTSQELEHPFGDDEDDIDMKAVQEYSNNCLRVLLSPALDEAVGFAQAAKGGRGDLRCHGAEVMFAQSGITSEGSSDTEAELGPKRQLVLASRQ